MAFSLTRVKAALGGDAYKWLLESFAKYTTRTLSDGSKVVDGIEINGKRVYIDNQPVPMLPNGQPAKIARPVTSIGRKAVGFESTAGWWLMAGTEGVDVNNTMDYTGLDPTTGAVTGIVSRTGSHAMRKMQILTDATVQIGITSNFSQAFNGKFGLWVYVEAPDSKTNVGLTLTLNNGGVDYGFNNNQVKPNAWNFLVACRLADPTSNTDREAHPFGVAENIYNYAVSNWVTQPVTQLRLYVQNMSGVTLYLDSIWTGFSAMPQFVLGADMTGNDSLTHMLPKFQQYGWRGYIAQPKRVHTYQATVAAVNTTTETLTLSGSADVLANTTARGLEVLVSSTGTLPAPLVAGARYFVIPVDSTNIKLATTADNARLGTAIDITSAGTGTISLNAGWADVKDWNVMGGTTKQVIDALYAEGWDIINHSANHQQIGTYTDPGKIRYEIEATKNWLDSNGWIRGQEFYASPQSSTSMLSRRVIEAAGIKVQRHGTHDANHVTAFGVDEPRWVGSVDVGGNGWIYNGADPSRYPYNYPHIQNIRTWVDMIIKYQATAFPFWHGIKTLGDPGDGTGNSGDSIQMFKSTYDLMMDYIAQKEAAGLCRVTDGFTGFYYGIGR